MDLNRSVTCLAVLMLVGCPMESGSSTTEDIRSSDAGTSPMDALDGAEGGDGDTGGSDFIDGEDHLQPSLSLPSCDVAEPLEITEGADMLDVRALVLVDDTLLAGALDGVYSVSKDGGAPPVKLGERGTTGDLAVLDGVACTAQGVFLEAEVIPGFGSGATLDVEGGRGDTLLTADEALKLLLEDTRLDGPLAVSSTSVYFGLSDGAVNSEYLARLPVGGGDVEVLAGPNGIDGIAVDDRGGGCISSLPGSPTSVRSASTRPPGRSSRSPIRAALLLGTMTTTTPFLDTWVAA